MKEFVDKKDKGTEIDEEYITKVEEIIGLICTSDFAVECGTCTVECTEACVLMKFIIRQMLWTCKNFTKPIMCIHFKNLLYENFIGDFA